MVETCLLGSDKASSADAWDQFVQSSSDGMLFHLTMWKELVEEVFRHKPHYIVARSRGEIFGVLPLFEVCGFRAGHCLYSVPYAVYGGICGLNPEASAALIREAKCLAQRLRVRYVELRQLQNPMPGLPTRRPFVTFAKLMDPEPKANFLAIPRKQRRMIRKGKAYRLEARRGWEPLAEFYQTYSINCRRLGAPPFPRRLFEVIRDRFGSAAQLLTIWHDQKLVAGVISFFHQDRVMPYYGASLPEGRTLAANDFMYWELMRASCLAGYRVFDFGQSHVGSGAYNFKRNWGFEPDSIAYQYVLVRDTVAPTWEPSSTRLDLAIEAWKRVPLPLTKWLGPALIRWLPLY